MRIGVELFDWQRLAGQGRLVDEQVLGRQHAQVGGNHVPGRQETRPQARVVLPKGPLAVRRVEAEGGFMVCEADNPADILEGTAKLANYVQYKCHPVVDVAEWVQAGLEGIGFRNSVS